MSQAIVSNSTPSTPSFALSNQSQSGSISAINGNTNLGDDQISNNSNSLSNGAIAGITIGSIAGAGLIGFGVWQLLKKPKTDNAKATDNTKTAQNTTTNPPLPNNEMSTSRETNPVNAVPPIAQIPIRSTTPKPSPGTDTSGTPLSKNTDAQSLQEKETQEEDQKIAEEVQKLQEKIQKLSIEDLLQETKEAKSFNITRRTDLLVDKMRAVRNSNKADVRSRDDLKEFLKKFQSDMRENSFFGLLAKLIPDFQNEEIEALRTMSEEEFNEEIRLTQQGFQQMQHSLETEIGPLEALKEAKDEIASQNTTLEQKRKDVSEWIREKSMSPNIKQNQDMWAERLFPARL